MTSSPLSFFSSSESGAPVKRALCVLAPVVLALSACGPEEPAGTAHIPATSDRVLESTAVTPVESSPSRSSETIVTLAMKNTLADEGIHLPESMYYEYAQVVCEGIADGVDPMDAAYIGADALPSWSLMDHVMMVGASIGALCPEQSYRIDGAA